MTVNTEKVAQMCRYAFSAEKMESSGMSYVELLYYYCKVKRFNKSCKASVNRGKNYDKYFYGIVIEPKH